MINERLNKIEGRKAIVLFTDGVDTKSYLATSQSTLREAEELDALIYAIQYDTTDFVAATQTPSNDVTIFTRRTSSWPYGTTQRVINGPAIPVPGTTIGDYQLADQYLHQLSEKTGALLYRANDRAQLAAAFSKIAGELRSQYSLGYYPNDSREKWRASAHQSSSEPARSRRAGTTELCKKSFYFSARHDAIIAASFGNVDVYKTLRVSSWKFKIGKASGGKPPFRTCSILSFNLLFACSCLIKLLIEEGAATEGRPDYFPWLN